MLTVMDDPSSGIRVVDVGAPLSRHRPETGTPHRAIPPSFLPTLLHTLPCLSADAGPPEPAQWSETRVLALRGLSRVIKFCTRFLLREKWFADIWAEALHASQVAMVSAVDELEVAVAAVDVVFSMIKTVINMDNELTVAPATTASSSSSAGKKKTPQPSSSARPSSKTLSPAVSSAELQVLSKEDFEQLQSSKEDLWKRTWAAVHHAAAFPCPWYHGSSLNECYLFPDRYLCLCMCVCMYAAPNWPSPSPSACWISIAAVWSTSSGTATTSACSWKSSSRSVRSDGGRNPNPNRVRNRASCS